MVAAGGELRREITPQAAALFLHLLDRAERLVRHATATSRSPSASTWPTSGRLNSSHPRAPPALIRPEDRTEEHTSELQSPCNLVRRLLLQKKTPRARHAHARPAP